MALSEQVALTTITIVVGLITFVLVYERIRDRSLPPGPQRLPLIGNLHQAPKDFPWLTFTKWIRQYGPIISVQFGGTTLIMIGDAQIAKELLDKRGSIYSDRPRMVMAGENLTKGMHMLLRPYTERYRLHQRLQAPTLSPRDSPTYFPLQDVESKQLMFDFLHSNDYGKILERYAGSLMYSLTYGFRLDTGDEEPLREAHKVQHNFAYAARVGTWVVDALPFLNVLPPALAPWKRTAEEFFEIEKALHLKNMQHGLDTKAWNWTKEFSKAKESDTMSELELAYSLGILADAGLDTTAVQMRIFILAALSYPGFLERAQKELDEVVGPDRLPCLDDKPNLPYIDAVLEETIRWRSMAPGGIPHATTREDTIETAMAKYRIPKGATVISIYWAQAMNEDAFERPLEFIPERWLDKSEDPQRFTSVFGYSRRICPGRHIARSSLFLLMARILWGFNIKHAVDENGNKEEVDDLAFTSGFLSTPVPFVAAFEPRSAHAKAVIEEEWEAAERNVDVLLNSARDRQSALQVSVRAI
ncbi:hypothetical protein AJ80_00657 [Polytolypa hystricis UAMH7299]|uniref:Cytochrome P450 oxidoreductase n=1 Tax=Polytolypa hystricis (strain UAMH7299) TaxID=1447883 RepID=A0A2B7YUB1_POLH7|nr:hypothetical protein AJ80_00657 [Polytolypa hystricis UAMH7299]